MKRRRCCSLIVHPSQVLRNKYRRSKVLPESAEIFVMIDGQDVVLFGILIMETSDKRLW